MNSHAMLRGLRAVGLVAVVVGAVASVLLMLRAGHPPLALRLLFAGWVLSPFVALVVADVASKRRSVPVRATLHGLMLILAAGSLACYGGLVPIRPGSRPAFMFLMIPLGSWVLLATAIPIAAFVARRRTHPRADA